VLAVSVFQTLQGSPPPRSTNQAARVVAEPAFTREAFWKHSIAVASAAELLARHVPSIDPTEAFISGLLHDLGKIALDTALPKSFAKVIEAVEILRSNIADVERQIIGLDHLTVGKRLAEKWHLPERIRDCIWLHGQLPSLLPATISHPGLVNLITLADHMAREMHVGYSGNYVFRIPSAELTKSLGLTQRHLDEVQSKLVSAIEDRAGALGLGETSSQELYQQALTRANRELGRVSTQLAAKNKNLAARAKFFDGLAKFHGAVAPDSAPRTVLEAIGETAKQLLGAPSLAAVSLAPGQPFAEAVIGGEVTIVDAAVKLSAHPPGSIFAVGPELAALMDVLSPRLGGGEKRFWAPLMAEGNTIGLLVWPSLPGQPDELQRLSSLRQEMTGILTGFSLALRTAQIRDEARQLSEQLAQSNRTLNDAQSELLRARTLVGIAEMAAGAAHEMNNPLAVISGRSQLLASQISDEKHRKSAQLIAEQAMRLSDMITELMNFAKPCANEARELSVQEILSRAVEQAKRAPEAADREVEVAADVGDVPMVRVDPEHAVAALAEIVSNALQATAEKGGNVRLHATADPFGGQVAITVADDGCGMDEHTLQRAFDPFFSSMPAGRRRGMGLAKALRWVESFGGSIRLSSQPGGGTRATLLLPTGERGVERDGSTLAAGPLSPHRAAG
jgi:putative nucleotidyltransferase with HDIG domain